MADPDANSYKQTGGSENHRFVSRLYRFLATMP